MLGQRKRQMRTGQPARNGHVVGVNGQRRASPQDTGRSRNTHYNTRGENRLHTRLGFRSGTPATHPNPHNPGEGVIGKPLFVARRGGRVHPLAGVSEPRGQYQGRDCLLTGLWAVCCCARVQAAMVAAGGAEANAAVAAALSRLNAAHSSGAAAPAAALNPLQTLFGGSVRRPHTALPHACCSTHAGSP